MKPASRDQEFKKTIRKHYRTQGRHDLSWRKTRDPYAILVSEVMLQQTQVSRVEGYYARFLARFPDFPSLAHAATGDVLAAWQGLGYNRRALSLKRLAEIVMREHGGVLPSDREALARLPGIGKGTSGSLMAFAFDRPEIFIETNIRRVFIHHFFPRTRRGVTDAEIGRYIQRTMDHAHPREWYWALMDYGASLGKGAATGTKERTIARTRSVSDRNGNLGPFANPNRRSAHYRIQRAFKGSDREMRGRVLRYLLAVRDAGEEGSSGIAETRLAAVVGASGREGAVRMRRVLSQLLQEGFIIERQGFISINNE